MSSARATPSAMTASPNARVVAHEIDTNVVRAIRAAGQRRGWSVYSLMLPYGADVRYNYATVDAFENYGDLVAPFPQELAMQAHPGATEADFDAMMDRTTASRTLLQGQLWRRLAHVDAETMGSN